MEHYVVVVTSDPDNTCFLVGDMLGMTFAFPPGENGPRAEDPDPLIGLSLEQRILVHRVLTLQHMDEFAAFQERVIKETLGTTL